MQVDLIIRDGTVVSHRGVEQANIAVRDGIIVAIGNFEGLRSKEVLDAKGLHILPGVIDTEIHHTVQYVNETRAAVKGGITTAFFLVIGLLGYNYFWGTAQEKEQAQEIFSKGAEAIGAGADLLKSEYQKYNDGKYDEALDNIGDGLSKLKENSGELLGEIDSWEERKEDWDQKKIDLQEQLDADLDSINEEKLKRAFAALKEEREILENEGKRLKEKAE